MMPYWCRGCAVLALVALISCGQAGASQPTPAALPTADIAVRAAGPAQIIPLTPTATITVLETEIPVSPAGAVRSNPPASTAVAAAADLQSAAGARADAAWAALEAQLIVEINKVRVLNGLQPYEVSPELSAAARAHSCDLATHHLISHSSSDGRTLAERLAGSTPPWEWPSESIAAGTADPATVVAWWMDEPPEGWHRRNILDEQQQAVGAGYCYAEEDPSGNHSYWTADFARRAPQQ